MTEEERKKAKAAAQKHWYQKNKDRHVANVMARKALHVKNMQDYVRNIKEQTPCSDCGINYAWYVMDFDHLRNKEYQISRMVLDGHGLETIKEEIEKCEIVCSNCHRIRTHNRRSSSSTG